MTDLREQMGREKAEAVAMEKLLRDFANNGGLGGRYFMGDDYREAARHLLAKIDRERLENL